MSEYFDLQELLGEIEEDDSQVETPASVDINEVKKWLPSYQTQKICEMVVCSRYFGFDAEITTMCMQELAQRRQAGDTFQFEDFIEAELKKLPQLSVGMPDLRAVLSQIAGKGFRNP